MGNSRAALEESGATLRLLARELSDHGVGGRWQGPARRECELQLTALVDDLWSVARRLDVAAAHAGVHSVRADM